jgi:hypothetical protein
MQKGGEISVKEFVDYEAAEAFLQQFSEETRDKMEILSEKEYA